VDSKPVRYFVSVDNVVDERTAVLNLDVFDLEEKDPVRENLGFALTLFYEGAAEAETGALLDEVTPADLLDPEWLRSHARGFVERVEIVRLVTNEDDEDRGTEPVRVIWGQLRITVTHQAWLEALYSPLHWESPAVVVTDEFDAVPARSPRPRQERLERDLVSSDGFCPFPRELLLSITRETDRWPEVLWTLRYQLTCYRVTERIPRERIDAEALRPWLGRPVMLQEQARQEEWGILVDYNHAHSYVRLAHMALGVRGFAQRPVSRLESVGLLEYRVDERPKKRPLTYAHMLDATPPSVVRVRVEGDRATFALRFYSTRPIEVQSATHVLALIAWPLADEVGRFSDENAPLARTLRSEGVYKSHELRKVAAGYVLGYVLEPADSPQLPDLEAMSNAERLEWFESSDWPECRLHVHVSDPAWLVYLPDVRPYAFPQGDFEAPPPSPPRTFAPDALID
jgi:hypothetical protein